jgi:hypothetical protein
MSDDIPQDDEPLFALQDGADERMNALRQFACTTYVSDEVRRECEAELAAAKKTGYKIYKHPKQV